MKCRLSVSAALITAALFLPAVIAGVGFADGPAAGNAAGRGKAPLPRNEVTITPAREAAAMTFAREHHPRLADLLVRLQKAEPKEYQTAIRQLFETSERLARIANRFPERYDLELRVWKIGSQIRLLLAEAAVTPNSSHQHELRALLTQRVELRAELMAVERDRLLRRVERLDEAIDSLVAGQETIVERELTRLRRSVSPAGGRPDRPKAEGRNPSARPRSTTPSEAVRQGGGETSGRDAR